jgi:hypothetical protein
LRSFAPHFPRVGPSCLESWCAKAGRIGLNLYHRQKGLLLLCAFLLCLCGCSLKPSASVPSIEFTRIPPAANSGKDKVDVIQGRVSGARPGQRVVLYAKNGIWWVQPLANEPYTTLNPDLTWTNSTHVGTDYAALLVDPGYHPPDSISGSPTSGGGVAALTIVKGSTPEAGVSKTLFFSGYEWRIRDAPSDRGGPNDFDSHNAWTDDKGMLHLRIAKVSDKWTCAEVTLTRSLGYGTYSIVTEDTTHTDPAAVLSMFTWDYAGEDPRHREMDIEVTHWGDPAGKNAQYVIQPFYVPENVSRFMVPAGVLTYSFHWEPGRLEFRTVPGSAGTVTARPIAEHVFASGVPSHGLEAFRMSFYAFHYGKEPLQNASEVVIEKFEYLP